MELYEGLLSRRSIRKYNPEKTLTKDEILELIRAASYAPSAHNKQPWHFLVLEDKEVLRTLRAVQPWTSFAKDAACVIVVCADEEETFHREKRAGTMHRLTARWLPRTCCSPATPKVWALVLRRCADADGN